MSINRIGSWRPGAHSGTLRSGQALFTLIALIFIFTLAACAPAPTPTPIPPTQLPAVLSPTNSPIPTRASTPTPPVATATPKPTATIQKTNAPAKINTPIPVPTTTPYSPLSATGPHLAYIANTTVSGRTLTILNADASGREVIPIPDSVVVGDLSNALSPNGEWLAFHTGSAGTSAGFDNVDLSGPLDLTLKLMHLPDGKISTVSMLLSKDYPANFDQTAAQSIQSDPRYSGMDMNSAKQVLAYIFFGGIRGVDWSPDSRYLAFSGEMDGPSSDLYVYDIQTRQIKRLTDGPSEMTGKISWSPDGKWIMHGSDNEPPGEGMTQDIFVVRPDGTGAKKIVNSRRFGEWISPSNILLYESNNGIGTYDLHLINAETDEIKTIWPGPFSDFAFDQNAGSIAVCAVDLYPDHMTYCVYVFLPNKPRLYVQLDDECAVLYRKVPSHQFIEMKLYDNHGFSYITEDGKLVPSKIDARLVAISPDTKWLLASRSKSVNVSNLELYDENDAFVKELLGTIPDIITMRPDSGGIYYRAGTMLYYLGVPDGQPVIVGEIFSPLGPYDLNYCWVR